MRAGRYDDKRIPGRLCHHQGNHDPGGETAALGFGGAADRLAFARALAGYLAGRPAGVRGLSRCRHPPAGTPPPVNFRVRCPSRESLASFRASSSAGRRGRFPAAPRWWLARRAARKHLAFPRQPAAFAQVARAAGGDDVLPGRATAAAARDDVVEGQVRRRAAVAAILAGESVAQEHVEPGEGRAAGRRDIVLQRDHAGQAHGQRWANAPRPRIRRARDTRSRNTALTASCQDQTDKRKIRQRAEVRVQDKRGKMLSAVGQNVAPSPRGTLYLEEVMPPARQILCAAR